MNLKFYPKDCKKYMNYEWKHSKKFNLTRHNYKDTANINSSNALNFIFKPIQFQLKCHRKIGRVAYIFSYTHPVLRESRKGHVWGLPQVAALFPLACCVSSLIKSKVNGLILCGRRAWLPH